MKRKCKNSIFYILLLLLSSCSNQKVIEEYNENKNNNIDKEKLGIACNKQNETLACAKLGYYYQKNNQDDLAYKYYFKGCKLKDQISCHNLNNLKNTSEYSKKIDHKMKLYSGNASSCHLKTNKERAIFSQIQLKENNYKVEISFRINNQGKAEQIEIKTLLPKEFKICALDELDKINFPTSENTNRIFHYNINILSTE